MEEWFDPNQVWKWLVPFYHTQEYQLLHSKIQQTLYYKHEPSVNNFYINHLGYGNFYLYVSQYETQI